MVYIPMCIVCKCGDAGEEFLFEFAKAQSSMKSAGTAMLRCAESAKEVNAKRQYSMIHKKMVRILREWNAIEHERERLSE